MKNILTQRIDMVGTGKENEHYGYWHQLLTSENNINKYTKREFCTQNGYQCKAEIYYANSCVENPSKNVLNYTFFFFLQRLSKANAREGNIYIERRKTLQLDRRDYWFFFILDRDLRRLKNTAIPAN